MIEVAHLHRRYGPLTAVDDLSFSLDKGDVVGFLGPNGAGKTTTMRILAGYLPASQAERVLVAGFDVLRQSMEVRKRIGYLPESVPLYPERRVQEMLRLHGRLHGMDRATLRDAIPDVLDRVGVLDRRKQLVGHLSRGLKQRVGLAVALLPNPEVLILDEPTSGLDPLQRAEVRDLIRELSEEHTVLVSSHILAEIEMICPRVIVLDRGRLLADGTQAELLERWSGDQEVRLEAMCGDPAEAERLLTSLPGVTRVVQGERLGIHQSFRIFGEGDLREDVGALAMQKGWALRELSIRQFSLEEIFAKLVSGELSPGAVQDMERAPAAPGPSQADGDGDGVGLGVPIQLGGVAAVSSQAVQMEPASRTPAASPPGKTDEPAASSQIYSLNPFDRGAARDLSKPVARDPQDDPSGGSNENPEASQEQDGGTPN